jgi:CHASE2 domain-containing sensor protein
MGEQLSQDERGFVTSLLEWDSEVRQRESLLLLVALAAGGIVIVGTVFMTLRHLTSLVAAFLTVPGFGLGVALILVYVLRRWRLSERHRVAGILRKLGAADATRAD